MTAAVPTDAQGNAIEALDVLAGKAKEFLSKASRADKDAENYRISAGQLLIEAKARITAGEKDEGGHKIIWSRWSKEHFKRSRQDIHRIMRIAAAPDPTAALAADREETRQRVAAIRQNPVTYVRDKTPAPTAAPQPEPVDPPIVEPARDLPWVPPWEHDHDRLSVVVEALNKLTPGQRSALRERLTADKYWPEPTDDELKQAQRADMERVKTMRLPALEGVRRLLIQKLKWIDDELVARGVSEATASGEHTVAEAAEPPTAALPPEQAPVAPPVPCNTGDGTCRYGTCISIGCCQVAGKLAYDPVAGLSFGTPARKPASAEPPPLAI